MYKKITLITLFFLLIVCSSKENDTIDDLFKEIEENTTNITGTNNAQSTTNTHSKSSYINSEEVLEDYNTLSNPNGNYTIQVHIFRKVKNAHQAQQKLKAAGIPAYVATISKPTDDLNDNLYHRVRIGYFESINQAKQFAQNHLSTYKYWIAKRTKE